MSSEPCVHGMKFNSRRSPVYGTHGMVASSQPLASMAGIEILKKGGNAADAAVAVASSLNMTEPCSTGIGGDAFCLFFDAKTKKVRGLNASGRAPAALNLEYLAEHGIKDRLPPTSPHTVTVPGAAAGWVDTIEKFGTMTMPEVLAPAIRLGEEGFPVSPITARAWDRGIPKLKTGPHYEEMLLNGKAPRAGEIMKNKNLAHTFHEVAEHGKAGFYEGRIAEEIVKVLEPMGGVMTVDDLKNHYNTFPEPITTNYKGLDVYEIPPNGQGITALIALNILEEYDFTGVPHGSTKHLHTLIEAMRLAFADTRWYVADPDVTDVPIQELISKKYAAKRRKLLNPEKATVDVQKGSPVAGSDTVYFCVVDGMGNACSFIISNYAGFGTGIIPKGCGFTLQNRGFGFSLDPEHPNRLEPNKRPYHTIIPGMLMQDGELYAPFGVMGGFMQPQGHTQVVVNMVDYGMNPQEALDAGRFCILNGQSGGKVHIEDEISVKVMSELTGMGHEVVPSSGWRRGYFGRGQIIHRNPESGVLTAGSDPRADGCAVGW
ncbi:gamma-glutamyltransferase [Candidatus Bathyarchaeota archaeon]|nr:MAG: gamma-glutamyltransferase [Candidatus Bathyarchaeota archaeon]